ncbi:hypothetical protein TNCT_405311 [Trichonephila clavata]|uniref:Uncharacterized protein n=1 Tax=Trichonephila clavata TaxID=2740835 RepID=A0A8X6F633_TRICU|nr:hypothetical protein TNCT_405311 [Trichonephila clavata]
MKDLILLSLFCTLSHQLVKAGDTHMEFLKKIGVPSHYIRGEDNSYSHKYNQFPGAGVRFREDKMNHYRFPGAWTRIREDQMNNYETPSIGRGFLEDELKALQCIRSFVKLAIEKYSLIRQFLEQLKQGMMEEEKKES